MKTKPIITSALAIALATQAFAGEIKYSLWDSNQMPAYQQCAADFMAQNPGIKITINQSGWDDYWTALSTGFVSGTAPDVFTNHLAKYPEFVKNNLLVDLSDYIERDKVDAGQYRQGLYQIWGKDGKQYGLPKDWDTIAMLVNMDMAKAAGVTLDELNNMTWNPKDGGSFEQIVKKLTLDKNGHNAMSPAFEPNEVVTYGYQTPGSGNMMGQTEWSHFAVSSGFRFQDAPWDGNFHYDSPELASTIDYLASLADRHLSADFKRTQSLGSDAMFIAKKVAIIPQGSWMITYFNNSAKFNNQWVPLPIGPNGKRATTFNGLADSIWTGSKNKEESWLWVKYLGSSACQSVVAERGVVFPAIKGLAERAIEVQKGHGVDSSAFLIMAESETFLPPIANNGSRIAEIMDKAIQSVFLGRSTAEKALSSANKKIIKLNR
ncbi:ABC transporter substrate-binding protein [Gynuella sunshinyii]|uniref:ABC-type sugar transport system, periplasmic component n=1 Tax=Gynuella sunshinyii YC6258 TaxID=1445510 RepID=A0A0C5VMF9_9GAMM|nr:sugar ABC transporter substrate-binding protein [Gynuella sunshinyii]AJQ95506.1 ABC-type sugar transport system, periplasmic component [Gynuella sunshinyii YC6258]